MQIDEAGSITGGSRGSGMAISSTSYVNTKEFDSDYEEAS